MIGRGKREMQTNELPAVSGIPEDAWFAVDTGTAVVKVFCSMRRCSACEKA